GPTGLCSPPSGAARLHRATRGGYLVGGGRGGGTSDSFRRPHPSRSRRPGRSPLEPSRRGPGPGRGRCRGRRRRPDRRPGFRVSKPGGRRMRRAISAGNRLVVKVGSSSLVEEGNRIDESGLSRVVNEVAGAWEQGYPTVLVSSGAVAAGLPALGLDARPTDLPTLQVAAAVGQSRLMHRYSEAFADRGLIAGQILLTRDVLAHREQYLHARQALSRMLTEGIVPVVNENDTVGIDGLRLGDNDRLAAIVSHLVQASLLVILTDTAGLFASDPRVGDA